LALVAPHLVVARVNASLNAQLNFRLVRFEPGGQTPRNRIVIGIFAFTSCLLTATFGRPLAVEVSLLVATRELFTFRGSITQGVNIGFGWLTIAWLMIYDIMGYNNILFGK